MRSSREARIFTSTVLLVSLAAGIAFSLFSRLDIGGEDGVYYTPAIALRDGLVIHRDVFSQYGPVFAEFQSLFMRLFGVDTVLSLRYLNATLLAVTGATASYALVRVYRPSTVIGGLIAWFASAYFFTRGIPMLAWPSVLSLLLSVVVLALVLDVSGTMCLARWRYSAAGLVSGTQIFVRLNLGVTTSIGLCLVLFLVAIRSKVHLRAVLTCLASFLVGLAGSSAIWIARLSHEGALQSFFDQSVRAPASYYLSGETHPGITNGEVPIQHMARFGIVYGFPAALAIVCLAVILHFRILERSRPLAVRISATFVPLTTVGFSQLGLANDRFSRFAVLYGVVVLCVIVGPALILALTTALVRGNQDSEPDPSLSSRILVIGFAIASAIQLYPGDDPRHLFWVGLIPMMVVLGEIGRIIEHPAFTSAFCAVWATLAMLGPAADNLSLSRVQVDGDIAYAGLFVAADTKAGIDALTEALSSIPRGSTSLFLCDDAQLASWFKKFQSFDRMYVTWPWQLEYPSVMKYRSQSLREVNYVTYCGTPDDAQNWASTNGFTRLGGGESVSILVRGLQS